MSEKTGTFVVTHVDAESAVLTNVADAHVHTLSAHPDFSEGEVLEATVRAEPPMEVTWEVVAVHDRRTIPVERSPERPTKLARDIAGDQSIGEVTRREREGVGEIHVLTVPEDQTEQAVEDVIDDDETRRRAARLGVDRVEIRADAGCVSVRYLP
ncbi:hypothetical protein HLRTI_001574 [Halorhabdus tiamatea SARL4B]|uniref:Uncharacterized protein n=1 Tax=Halorhabdus tiamatea SARL4B TaxID=1033806 RepID=F7PM22_9EURY|nr:DUF5812 family protein [Halorhabdus tiamatea]ERJ06369.1 hypothetical protein HLRTI_001574 [Halorhabdus tiamatea SARL4B]CCQ34537.1 conserved hypothetical protein [Halorhabdus tiamatea SARL4B]